MGMSRFYSYEVSWNIFGSPISDTELFVSPLVLLILELLVADKRRKKREVREGTDSKYY
jgi:hypothetical protein